jgi:hypothetical protein
MFDRADFRTHTRHTPGCKPPIHCLILGSLNVVFLAALEEITNWPKCKQLLTHAVHLLPLQEGILHTTGLYKLYGYPNAVKYKSISAVQPVYHTSKKV